MSYQTAPVYLLPGHGTDPIATLFGSNRVSGLLKAKVAKRPDIWTTIKDEIENIANDVLDVCDDYLTETPEELFNSTSVYTGNTRGALKFVGKYPFTEVEFDVDEWFKPKTLANLVTKVVYREWKTKKHGQRSKSYVYEPGKLKAKITGEDYAPRIPSPPHGGGNVHMLKAVFEELRDDSFDRIVKKKGF